MIMIILVLTDRLHNHDIDDQCIIYPVIGDYIGGHQSTMSN